MHLNSRGVLTPPPFTKIVKLGQFDSAFRVVYARGINSREESMESVIINNAPFVISNDSDYYFDGTLHSTYGFEIYYRPRKGIR